MQPGQRINPYRLFTGSFLPTWLLERRELSPGAKLVYARLARYAGKRGVAYPRQLTLAREVGLGVRQVKRHIAELRRCELVAVALSGRGKPARYYFLGHLWITGGEVARENPDRPHVAPQKPSARTHVAPQETRPLKACARAVVESVQTKRVTAARGGSAAPRGPVLSERGNPKTKARVLGLLAGIGKGGV
jgi:Helix-turn-helix domain